MVKIKISILIWKVVENLSNAVSGVFIALLQPKIDLNAQNSYMRAGGGHSPEENFKTFNEFVQKGKIDFVSSLAFCDTVH